MPFSLHLDDDQRDLQRWARDFAANEIRPVASKYDEAEETPWPVVERAAEIGLYSFEFMTQAFQDPTGLSLPIVSEEIFWGCAGIGLAIFGTGLAATGIVSNGTPEQILHWAPRCYGTPGDVKLGAWCMTEPQAGSDVSNVQTTAVRDGDEWVLNGTKIYCTNGARAEIVVVNATVDKSLGRKGQKFFVVQKGTPGFKIGKIEKKMGLTASETAELSFEDCRIPFDHILGGEAALEPEGSGFKGTMKAFDSSRPSVAAMAVGIGRAAYEYARDWVEVEVPDDASFPRRRLIDSKLGQMRRELSAARGLVWQAAWMADSKIPNSKEASMAKAYAPQAALRACIGAIQVMGPEGYSKEHLVEKWFRDIKVYDIFEGTGQIQRVVISRKILGRLD